MSDLSLTGMTGYEQYFLFCRRKLNELYLHYWLSTLFLKKENCFHRKTLSSLVAQFMLHTSLYYWTFLLCVFGRTVFKLKLCSLSVCSRNHKKCVWEDKI